MLQYTSVLCPCRNTSTFIVNMSFYSTCTASTMSVATHPGELGRTIDPTQDCFFLLLLNQSYYFHLGLNFSFR